MRHEPVGEYAFLDCLKRIGRIKIIKYFKDKRQRGLWEGDLETKSAEAVITIAWAAHRRHDFAYDMVNTLIHEVVHQMRKAASESWVRKAAGCLYLDHKVRAAAAIRLLDVTYFGGEGEE